MKVSLKWHPLFTKGKIALANTLMQLFTSIFSKENRTPGLMLEENLKIILGTSQTLVKMQGIDRERQYFF